jgi:hypothetical protein
LTSSQLLRNDSTEKTLQRPSTDQAAESVEKKLKSMKNALSKYGELLQDAVRNLFCQYVTVEIILYRSFYNDAVGQKQRP